MCLPMCQFDDKCSTEDVANIIWAKLKFFVAKVIFEQVYFLKEKKSIVEMKTFRMITLGLFVVSVFSSKH